MFSSILVGTDGSPSSLVAVRRAAQLASRLGAKLSVLAVKDSMREAEQALDVAREVAGAAFSPIPAIGDPADGIVAAAANVDADLVVVGNRGMQGRARFLGSVPNSVSHHLRSSLLIVATGGGDGEARPYREVFVGTDGSEGSATAINAAGALAKAFGAHVRVVHAFRLPSASSAVLATAGHALVTGNQAEADAAARGVVDAARTLLRDHAVPATCETAEGDAADILVGSARADDLIVTGSRGMSGVGRVLGSVPNNVSHHAPCDVLIVNTT